MAYARPFWASALQDLSKYKEHLNARCFDPCNRILNFWEFRRTPKSHFRECEWRPHTSLKVGSRQESGCCKCLIIKNTLYFIKYKVVFKFTMVHYSTPSKIDYFFNSDACWSCVFYESCMWLRRWGGLKIGLFPMNLTIMLYTFLLKNQGKFNAVFFCGLNN